MPSLIKDVNGSEVVEAQLADKETDLFTGLPFKVVQYTIADAPMLREMVKQQIGDMVNMMTDEMIVKMVNESLKESTATYSGNLAKLGYVDFDHPNMISIYPKDFEDKEKIVELISSYNDAQEENDKITYTDTVALLMSSVTTIINAISYVLIAFVAISLVVSSIMIGIITYISVLERTKEIGILRAIGASKKDISRVFNAETFIVGLAAGIIGIGATLLLNIVINIILFSLTGLATLKATLPVAGAIILVAISVGLTLIAGLIPSRVAAKKDPVIALRTE
jgi:putative ABC transport system permease protein